MSASAQRIFVHIASYRDPDCQATVDDLFAKATHPERLSVGVFTQLIPEEDGDRFDVKRPSGRIRQVKFDARDSQGVGWARWNAQSLWGGEEWFLQIDGHSRFSQGWDARLFEILEATGDKRAILSTYPRGFTPPRELHAGSPLIITAKEFDKHGVLGLKSTGMEGAAAEKRLAVRGAFMGACFVFGPAEALSVRGDPMMYFEGEEITTSVRYFTHGWNIYVPTEHVLWHDWNRKNRRSHWDDNADWYALKLKSVERVRCVLGQQKDGFSPGVADHIERFSLGAERSLAEFEAFAGVSFDRRTFEARERFDRDLAAPALTPARHEPRCTMETDQCTVFDDLVAPDIFEELVKWGLYQDYRYINAGAEKLSKTWRLTDGQPLRGVSNAFRHYDNPAEKKPWMTPVNNAYDLFAEAIHNILPRVKHRVGQPQQDFTHFSMSSFLYPAGSGLALHKDGRGVYSGAYTYFVNKTWDVHWGGLLIVLDPRTELKQEAVSVYGQGKYFRNTWLDAGRERSDCFDPGFGQVILPRANRIVFIDQDCLHMVTRVNEAAGENVRMAFSGFFQRRTH